MKTTSEICVIYYHGTDWNGVRARQQYLMSAISKYADVFYLDQGREVRGRIVRHVPQPNITCIRGLVNLVYGLERRGLSRLIPLLFRWNLWSLYRRYDRVILWTAENWLRPFRFVECDLFIYDCIDPCFAAHEREIREFRRREVECIRAADLVFASADALVDYCLEFNGNVALLNNACDPSDYAKDLVDQAGKPFWWPTQADYVAAYLGTIDSRFDFESAEAAVVRNPNIWFVFAGTIAPEVADYVDGLAAKANVICPGRISLTAGRYLLSHCSVGLIPFLVGAVNDAVNPVKLYAYAAMDKPIVGTNTRELRKHSQQVKIANGSLDFAEKVASSVGVRQDEEERADRRRFAQANTWTCRASEAWRRIQELLSRFPQSSTRENGIAHQSVPRGRM